MLAGAPGISCRQALNTLVESSEIVSQCQPGKQPGRKNARLLAFKIKMVDSPSAILVQGKAQLR